jgi:hypothetical protein
LGDKNAGPRIPPEGASEKDFRAPEPKKRRLRPLISIKTLLVKARNDQSPKRRTAL